MNPTMFEDQIAWTKRVEDQIADLHRRLDALEKAPDPAPRILMAGPNFGAISPGSKMTEAHLHTALGLGLQKTSIAQGLHTARVHDPSTLAVNYRKGAEVREDRLSLWADIDPTTDISVGFDVHLVDGNGAPTDLGGQAKFGPLLSGRHSGKQWPGGETLHAPDSLTRTVWHARSTPRFGLYLYTPTDSPGPDAGWGGHITKHDSSGYRRLVLLDPKHRPQPGGRHHISYSITGANNRCNAELTLSIDGTEAWAGPLGPIGPINVIGLTSRYGGPDSDAPKTSTGHRLSNIRLIDKARNPQEMNP